MLRPNDKPIKRRRSHKKSISGEISHSPKKTSSPKKQSNQESSSDEPIRSIEQDKINIKIFYYSINELSISSRIIAVNIEKVKTIDDLKKKISSDLSILDDHIQFKIKPPVNKLVDINEQYLFELKIIHDDSDVESTPKRKNEYIYNSRFPEKCVTFRDIENNIFVGCIFVHNLETVSDVKIKLAGDLSRMYENIKPEEISIYDINKEQITDLNKPLSSFKDFTEYYYLKINGNHKKKYSYSEMKDFDFDFENTKSYFYSISELKVNCNLIKINIKEVKNTADLTRKIASNHFLLNDQLFLINPPKTDLKNVENYYEFEYKIRNSQIDIVILIPDGKSLTIKHNNTISFNEIIESLRKEGYYYSSSCVKNNLELYNEGKKISHQGYPFLSVKKQTTVKLKFNGNIITLSYAGIEFIASEDDYSYEIYHLIKSAFPHALNIKIQDSHGNDAFKMKSTEKYFIQLKKFVDFYDIDVCYSLEKIQIDLMATVLDVMKQLAEKLSYIYEQVSPEKLILYDNNKTQLTDLKKQLRSYQEFDKKFYFKNPFKKKKTELNTKESNPEVDQLKKIIEEQKSRINELENLLEESNNNKRPQYVEVSQKPNDKSIIILNSDQLNNLEKIKKLGNSSNETKYEVCQTQTIKQTFILKILNELTHENFQNFIREHEMLKILDHPNILKTYGIFLSDKTNPPSILLEHWTMNLEERLKKNEIKNIEIIEFIYQIAEGMRYVHFQSIIHRNLNAKCIFFSDDGILKIGEFGISKLVSPSEQLALSMNGLLGDFEFLAPEMAEDEKYNEKVDVYSFGKLVLYLMNGGKFMKKKKSNQVEIPASFTEFSKEFIIECTQSDFEERPSFEDICDTIKNNFSKMIDLSKDEKQRIKSFIKQHKENIPNYSKI